MKIQLLGVSVRPRALAIVPLGVCVGILSGAAVFCAFDNMQAAVCASVIPLAFAVVIAVKVDN